MASIIEINQLKQESFKLLNQVNDLLEFVKDAEKKCSKPSLGPGGLPRNKETKELIEEINSQIDETGNLAKKLTKLLE